MQDQEPNRQPWETVEYTDNPDLPDPQDLVEVAKDFLPRPEALVFKPPARKVTITLDEKSIAFFKAEAAHLQVPYQRMIRNLLSEYVARHQAAKTPSA